MKWEVKNVNGQRGYGAFDWYQVQLINQYGTASLKGGKYTFGKIDDARAECDRRNTELAQMKAPRMGYDANGIRALVDGAAA